LSTGVLLPAGVRAPASDIAFSRRKGTPRLCSNHASTTSGYISGVITPHHCLPALSEPRSPESFLSPSWVRRRAVTDRAHDDLLPPFRALDRVENAVIPDATRPKSAQPSSQRLTCALRRGFYLRQGLDDGFLDQARKGQEILLRPTGKYEISQVRARA